MSEVMDDHRAECVRTVMAKLERMLTSKERSTNPPHEAVHCLIDELSTWREGGTMVDGWSDASLRALVKLIATSCSDRQLKTVTGWADANAKWVDHWEFLQRYKRLTGTDFPPGLDYDAIRRALAGEDGSPIHEERAA